MMEDSNDLDDVAHFLSSPNEINEVSSNENALQSSGDNIYIEGLTPSTIDSPCQNQTFRLFDDDLSYDHGNDFPARVIVSSPQYNIDTTSLHNSNEEIHQNVSLVKPDIHGLTQGKINSLPSKQLNYLPNSNSSQSDDVQSSSDSFLKNKLTVTLQRNDASHHLIEALRLEDNDPLVLVPLSMLQLGASRSRASREIYLNSQTERFSTSDRVTNAITSQWHPNSFVKTGQFSSLVAANQRLYQNIPRVEKKPHKTRMGNYGSGQPEKMQKFYVQFTKRKEKKQRLKKTFKMIPFYAKCVAMEQQNITIMEVEAVLAVEYSLNVLSNNIKDVEVFDISAVVLRIVGKRRCQHVM